MTDFSDDKEELQETENKPKKKPRFLLWIGLAVGSFIVVFISTLLWIVYIQKPQELSAANMNTQQGLADSLSAQTAIDSMDIAEVQAPPDSDSQVRIQSDNGTNAAQPEAQSGYDPQNTYPITQADTTPEVDADNTDNEAKQQVEVDYRQLAKIYSQMDAKSAADILNRLSTNMVVGILSEMRDRNAAQILMALDRSKAARLSQALSYKKTG